MVPQKRLAFYHDLVIFSQFRLNSCSILTQFSLVSWSIPLESCVDQRFPKRDRHSTTIWSYSVDSVSIPTRFSLNSLSFPVRSRWNPVWTGDPSRENAFSCRSSSFGLSSDGLLSRSTGMAVSRARIRVQ